VQRPSKEREAIARSPPSCRAETETHLVQKQLNVDFVLMVANVAQQLLARLFPHRLRLKPSAISSNPNGRLRLGAVAEEQHRDDYSHQDESHDSDRPTAIHASEPTTSCSCSSGTRSATRGTYRTFAR
jgi:hypothetical protein